MWWRGVVAFNLKNTSDECNEVIQNAWSVEHTMSGKLSHCVENLVSWKQGKFGDIRHRVRELRMKLDCLQ